MNSLQEKLCGENLWRFYFKKRHILKLIIH